MIKLIKLSVAVFTLFSSLTVSAGVTTVTCQAFNADGVAVSNATTFSANARMSRPLKVTEDGILYIRWNYYKSPLNVRVTHNPNYPFTWGVTELAYGQISQNENGIIEGTLDLSVYTPGYFLYCKQN